MNLKIAKRTGFSIVLTLALLLGLVAPVFAADTLTLTVTQVVPGGIIKVRVDGLPAGHEFTVRQGKFGTKGIGGYVIAHFNSNGGGTKELMFEIHKEVRGESWIDLRIEDGNGSSGWVSFDNTRFYPSSEAPTPAPPSNGQPAATPAPVGGAPAPAPASGGAVGSNLAVIASQQGGWVKVSLWGLPANKTFTVRIGVAGSYARDIYGYVVAHFETSSTGEATGTFEIPFALRNQPNLDFRAEANGAYIYVLTFPNVDFP